MIYFLNELKTRNETLFYFGSLCFVLAFVFLWLSKISTLQVFNVSAWLKPFKFAVSIGVYAWTMAWYCYYLPASFNVKIFNWGVVGLLGFEIVYIAWQAGRGQLSHFNTSTPVYALLFALMGIAASLVTFYTAYIGLLFCTNVFPLLPGYYLWAIRLGIFIFVVFSLQGFAMGAKLSHTVGAPDGTEGIPLLNWSKQFGDLRVAHFIGMHALQILPIVAYYIIKNNKGIWLLAGLYFILAAFTLHRALKGKPLLKARNNITMNHSNNSQ